jgi:hypothetical protein
MSKSDIGSPLLQFVIDGKEPDPVNPRSPSNVAITARCYAMEDTMARKSDPKTKEQLLDRMLSFDFDGDIRHLGVEPASIVRVSPNTLRLTFPDSGVTFELEVHRPREFSQAARAAEGRSFARGERRRLDGGPSSHP